MSIVVPLDDQGGQVAEVVDTRQPEQRAGQGAPPVYPPLAKMARQQGTVRFQATIGKDGTVEDLTASWLS